MGNPSYHFRRFIVLKMQAQTQKRRKKAHSVRCAPKMIYTPAKDAADGATSA